VLLYIAAAAPYAQPGQSDQLRPLPRLPVLTEQQRQRHLHIPLRL